MVLQQEPQEFREITYLYVALNEFRVTFWLEGMA